MAVNRNGDLKKLDYYTIKLTTAFQILLEMELSNMI